MPVTEFEYLLLSLGWSVRCVARRLEVGEATVRGWVAEQRVPAPVMLWLKRLAVAHQLNPPPKRREWERARL